MSGEKLATLGFTADKRRSWTSAAKREKNILPMATNMARVAGPNKHVLGELTRQKLLRETWGSGVRLQLAWPRSGPVKGILLEFHWNSTGFLDDGEWNFQKNACISVCSYSSDV